MVRAVDGIYAWTAARPVGRGPGQTAFHAAGSRDVAQHFPVAPLRVIGRGRARESETRGIETHTGRRAFGVGRPTAGRRLLGRSIDERGYHTTPDVHGAHAA